MDLWWNPRLDAHAFRDDHDIRVNIYKLYFENTVESRILELLNQPQLANDYIFHRMGIHSTPYNLDFILQPS
ncbi:hypothetical protein M407DRAFT_92329 [Tulasnella calospora MUT 4182]|uniref:Uncharacterized protein n=1 Tax=Tulasnella calospora MUT 4182 TaxID=1051891 RepID=A0A0C3QGF1_9AGAM|nr:hypothetical protein M407DRAFT_92329 [Tulasnella calospora MUT 4182]